MRTLVLLLVSSTLVACSGTEGSPEDAPLDEPIESVQPPERLPMRDAGLEEFYAGIRRQLDADGGMRDVRFLEFDMVLWRGAPVVRRNIRYAPWEQNYRVEADRNGQTIVVVGNWNRPDLTLGWVDGEPVTGDSLIATARYAEAVFEADLNSLLHPYYWSEMRVQATELEPEDGARRLEVRTENASSTGDERWVFWIDAESQLPTRSEYYRSADDTEPSNSTNWVDWTDHGPIKLSTRRTTDTESEIRFENVTVQTFIPPDRFGGPGS